MGGDVFHALTKVIIHAVHGGFLSSAFGDELTLRHHDFPKRFAQRGIVRSLFRDDIHGALQGLFGSLNPLFLIDISRGEDERLRTLAVLGQDFLRQRGKALFLCHGGSSLSLGTEGAIDIVDLRKGLRGG